jgi:hypothetical protein
VIVFPIAKQFGSGLDFLADMKTHIVQPGECMASIAAQYGLADAMHLYQHPSNAGLRSVRAKPDILHPGDRVTIPDLKLKHVTVPVDATHRFVMRRPKKKVQIKLLRSDGQAFATGPFELRFNDSCVTGTIAGDGLLQATIPVDVFEAELVIGKWTRKILIGHLNPMQSAPDGGVSGAQARLSNLGYDAGAADGVLGPKSRNALWHFQSDNGLEAIGELNSDTISALELAHGC